MKLTNKTLKLMGLKGELNSDKAKESLSSLIERSQETSNLLDRGKGWADNAIAALEAMRDQDMSNLQDENFVTTFNSVSAPLYQLVGDMEYYSKELRKLLDKTRNEFE